MSKAKKILTIAIVLLITAAAGAAYFVAKERRSAREGQASQLITQNACSLFTLDDAKKVLRGNIKQVDAETAQKPTDRSDIPPPAPEIGASAVEDNTLAENTSSEFADNKTGKNNKNNPSVCSYTQTGQGKQTVTVTVLPSEYDEAKKNFDAASSSGGKAVPGYGEKANWNTGKDLSGANSYGRLVMLEPGGLVTISGGPNDLEIAKKIATVVEGRLND
jgi:hypothetical protein